MVIKEGMQKVNHFFEERRLQKAEQRVRETFVISKSLTYERKVVYELLERVGIDRLNKTFEFHCLETFDTFETVNKTAGISKFLDAQLLFKTGLIL